MALRLPFAAVIVPFVFVACGDSTSSRASSGGASPDGPNTGPAGSGGEGATGFSGAAGASGAGAAAGLGGVSDHGGAGAGQSTSGGWGGTSASAGGGGAGVGGATGGSASAAGSGGQVAGIPSGWIVVKDADYSMIPGPNFETVRLMFAGVPCSGSSCHFGGRNHLQVDKTPDALYTYMLNFRTLECGKLIDTANPSESALVKYLRGPCGKIERMPSFKCFEDGDEYCVPEYYIQAIEQWIAKGAPR